MRTEKKIRNAMKSKTNWTEGEVNAAEVYKGWHQGSEYGWVIRPFNAQSIFLGTNEAEALDTIDNWHDA